MSQLRLTTNSNKINFSQITLNIQLQTLNSIGKCDKAMAIYIHH